MSTRYAALKWDDDGMPHSTTFGDIYFGGRQGMAESRCVFLHANRLAARWRAWPPSRATFTVGEIGFGTGLNFLMAWQLWAETAPQQACLHYVAVEKFPFKKSDFMRALRLWPALGRSAKILGHAYPHTFTTCTRWVFTHQNIMLTLLLGDARTRLHQYTPQHKVDAWFFDGFSPNKNPDAWSTALFQTLAKHTKKGASFGTFSAASIVKHGLQTAGFEVNKVPGFGKKRHRLVGQYTGISTAPIPTPTHHHRKVAIIGGGLAGMATAYHLAEKGWTVQVLEQQGALAQAASGHPQALLNHRFSFHPNSPAQRYKFASYQYARTLLTRLNAQALWSPCGLIQLAYNPETAQRQQRIMDNNLYPRAHVQLISAHRATTLSGIPLPYSGLYLPHSGWANLPGLCQKWAIHPRIFVHTATAVATCRWHAPTQTWTLWDHQGQCLMHTPRLIMANAYHATQFPPLQTLPLRYNRGQVTFVPATPASHALQTILRTNISLTPAHQGQHCLGATYMRQDHSTAVRAAEHLCNVEKLKTTLPHLYPLLYGSSPHQTTLTAQQGHAGIRASSPDKLPLVGPIDGSASRHPTLYVNIAHGSFGLSYALLAAKLLSEWLDHADQASPLWPLLHPHRFSASGR